MGHLNPGINRCSSNYVDMLSIISELWEKLKISFIKEHVLAHQDEINRSLTILEKLNYRMESLVKDILLVRIL